MGELLRALRARAADHPESPGLIASWPGVSAARMPVACAELQRQGHAVHEVAIVDARNKVRRGWTVDHTNGAATRSGAPARLAEELTVLVREVAEPGTVPLARAVVAKVAEREGVPETVRSALALALTEACTNVVLHAYVDADDAPGYLEVRACRVGAVLTVEVADDGRGMVPRVESPGLGLGLSLIAQMADVFEIRTERKRRRTDLANAVRLSLMAHFKCLRCRSRIWHDVPTDDLCPGCGDQLEAVAELSELIGLRLLPTRHRPERRTPPDRSARISEQIRETIARHDAERQRRIDAERS